MIHHKHFSIRCSALACVISVAFVLALPSAIHAQRVTSVDAFFSKNGVTVTKAMYPRIETARQMLLSQGEAGGVNKFQHLSTLTPTDYQPVVRMNRDAYYSKAVVDVSKGATVTLPDVPDGKYLSMQPVTEDHRPQPMSYGGGTYELATHTGDHVIVILRMDSTFTSEQVKRYQEQVRIDAASNKLFSAEPVNRESFDKVERDLKASMPNLVRREGLVTVTRTLFSSPTHQSRATTLLKRTKWLPRWAGAAHWPPTTSTKPHLHFLPRAATK